MQRSQPPLKLKFKKTIQEHGDSLTSTTVSQITTTGQLTPPHPAPHVTGLRALASMQDEGDSAANNRSRSKVLSNSNSDTKHTQQRKNSTNLLPPPPPSQLTPSSGSTSSDEGRDRKNDQQKSDSKSFNRGNERYAPYNSSSHQHQHHHHHHHHHHHNQANTTGHQAPPPPPPSQPHHTDDSLKPLDKMKINTDRKNTTEPKPLRFIDKLAKSSTSSLSAGSLAPSVDTDRIKDRFDRMSKSQTSKSLEDSIKKQSQSGGKSSSQSTTTPTSSTSSTMYSSRPNNSSTRLTSTTTSSITTYPDRPTPPPPMQQQQQRSSKETSSNRTPHNLAGQQHSSDRKPSDRTYERVPKSMVADVGRKSSMTTNSLASDTGNTQAAGSKQFERVKQEVNKPFDRLNKSLEKLNTTTSNILSIADESLKSDKGSYK